MQLEWLATFVEVSRQGSFTAAAHALGYTQSAVSRQVAGLESQCGAQLLERLPRGAVLTGEGTVLLEHADAILRRVREANRDVAAAQGAATARLRMGAFSTAIAALVPAALRAFRSVNPGIDISLVEQRTPQLVDALHQREVDLAVLSDTPQAEARDARLRLMRLLDEPMLAAVGADHRLAQRRTVRLAELASDPFVVGSATDEATLLRARLPADFEPIVDVVVADWTGKLGCVAAGLGVCLLPMLAARAAPADIRLLRLHPDDCPKRRIFAATRASTALRPPVKSFLTNLRDTASELGHGSAR